MKILLFTDSLGPGGAQRQICGLALKLVSHNYDVVVLTYHSDDFYKSCLDDNKIPNVVVGDNSKPFHRIHVIRKFIKKEKPQWVIAYQEMPSLIASVIKLTGMNFKLLVSERNTTQQITRLDKIRFNLYRNATVVVSNSYSENSPFIRIPS